MSTEFPLLTAALSSVQGEAPPGPDVEGVLHALGLPGVAYHSFQPPESPDGRQTRPAAPPGDPAATVPEPDPAPRRGPAVAEPLPPSDRSRPDAGAPTTRATAFETPRPLPTLGLAETSAPFGQARAAGRPGEAGPDRQPVSRPPAADGSMTMAQVFRILSGDRVCAQPAPRSLREVFGGDS